MNLQIEVRNFKSISAVELNLREGLNILIGPNGSGKTCILSSLKFVRDLFLFGAGQALARNGGAKRIYRRGTDTISFAIRQDYGNRIYRRRKWPCQFTWEIKISQSGPGGIATIAYEDLSIVAKVDGKDSTLFRYTIDRSSLKRVRPRVFLCEPDKFGRDLFSSWEETHSGESKPTIYGRFQATSRDLARQSRTAQDQSIFPRVARLDQELRRLHSLFLYLNEYNILPDIARQSTEQLPFAHMQPNGAGVSEVIHALQKRHYDRIELGRYYGMPSYLGYEFFDMEFFAYRYAPPYHFYSRFWRPERESAIQGIRQALESINRELAAAVKPIQSVSVETDPTNGRRFVVFRAGRETFVPEEVSDGTIKWLCILVSIFVPYSLVYILEEPENFLHPWMQQRLIQMMREHAKSNHTIFILASHSSTILNAATPEEVIVVCSTDQGTQISEIEDKAAIEQVLAKSDFRLGDFWVSGAIGGVP
jgi:predicted ATPase